MIKEALPRIRRLLESVVDRVVPVGLAARFVTSAIAGAALAPSRQRNAAAVAAGAAVLVLVVTARSSEGTSAMLYGVL